MELIDAMRLHADKESRGVGMQNFHYGPLLKQLAEEACCTSASLYRNVLSKDLPMPTQRSIECVFLHCIVTLLTLQSQNLSFLATEIPALYRRGTFQEGSTTP
jgi:hypothetical protein